MSCQKNLFKRLRQRGMRLTPQREMVLSIMHEMEDFSTVEQIYERVRAVSTSVDISTVYRTLDLFQDFHVVVAVDAGDGQRRYKLSEFDGPVLHLVCRSCNGVIPVSVEHAQLIAACLHTYSGFRADLEHMSIPGLCAQCSAAQE